MFYIFLAKVKFSVVYLQFIELIMIIDFLRGCIVGLGASIPLGPIGVMCIQRTLSKGRNSGLITGMGSAISDTIYAAVALLSLSFIQDFIMAQTDYLMLFGGLIVVLFGVNIFLKNPVKQIKRIKAGSNRYWQDFFSSVAMTITNPATLILVIGIMAFVGINVNYEKGSLLLVGSTLLGVFVGGFSWWLLLSTSVNRFRNRFRLRHLLTINRVSGVVIIVLGIITFFEGLIRLLIQIK